MSCTDSTRRSRTSCSPIWKRERSGLLGRPRKTPTLQLTPLLSRSQVFPLEPVPEEELAALLKRALADAERGLGASRVDMEEEALNHLAAKADGDARKAITALEVAVLSTPAGEDGVIHVNLSVAEESIQRKAIKYDRLGDSHYDTISAFIKSMRGSDPDAALYWLGMMLEAGEDIRFIGRRLVIAASEDVGLADSNALRVALDAARAAEMVGMPETHSSGACCGLPGYGPQEQFRLHGHQCRHG